MPYLIIIYIFWLLVFVLGKVGFMLYCLPETQFSAGDVFDVIRHGFSMDLSTAGYLVALPWLYYLVVAVFRRAPKRRFVSSWSRRDVQPQPWHAWFVPVFGVVASIVVVAAITADAYLYPFWHFKLNAIVFSYLDDTAGLTNSVSTLFIILRIVATLVLTILVAWGAWVIWRKTMRRSAASKVPQTAAARWGQVALLLLFGALDFLAIRGGIGTAVQNVGTAYYSQNDFLNHAAVNPAFSLATSMKRAQNYGEQFQFYSDSELQSILDSLMPAAPATPAASAPTAPAATVPAPAAPSTPATPATTASPAAPTLTPGEANPAATAALQPPSLKQRPNVLLIMFEGFGSAFAEATGGRPDVAPNFNRLVHEGVFFSNYYSNSFRTDRGTVSLLSGWTSYPTASLMRLPDQLAHVPCLASSLADAGYSTHYLYGGDINFTGTSGYLTSGGFSHITSDADFPATEAHSGKWGVPDSITAGRALDMITGTLAKEKKPWLLTYQTLSSHEPFEVPTHKFDDPVLNAFAYTDAAIDRLVTGLKQTSAWDNLLVILVPDHGYPYGTTYEDPEFFHCPMLWLGGAIGEARTVDTLMNQSDLCATLLSLMGLPHDAYPWSRDIFADSYTAPYVYCTYPTGIMFSDDTGTTVYDITSSRTLTDRTNEGHDAKACSAARLRKAKALLQKSYKELGTHKP